MADYDSDNHTSNLLQKSKNKTKKYAKYPNTTRT